VTVTDTSTNARPASSGLLLQVQDLRTHFFLEAGLSKAVDGVSFHLDAGKTLGIVGESGCGKSVTALSIMRLIPKPPGRIVSGTISFEGKELTAASEEEMRTIRGNDIAMIFQEPMTSLNPGFTIGSQIQEVLLLHQNVTREQARLRALDMLRQVGIPSPEIRIDEYPHQMSGGMRQRAMIAMALACNPKLLIADEPTTALDVSIQAQILHLIRKLQQDFGMSILLITHDLGVVAQTANDVAVMYAGKVVEYAPVKDLFARPRHPYTVGLFKSIPKLGQVRKRLDVIPGSVPNPLHLPSGCHFHPRCPLAQSLCSTEEPQLRQLDPSHLSSCHFAEKVR